MAHDQKPSGGQGFREDYLGRIRNAETHDQWIRGPSKAELQGTMNWFAAFWEHDAVKAIYSGPGFDWRQVYDEQPMVLVNLKSLAKSPVYAKAVAAMFIIGLVNHAWASERKRLCTW